MTMQQTMHLGAGYITVGGAGTRDGSTAVNAGASALQIKRQFPTSGSGAYWIKPPAGSAVQVYCDMTTDGGGWMLVARTNPGATLATAGTWGWRGPAIGSLAVMNNCYQLGIYGLWQNGLNFYQYMYGNQARNDDFSWGPYIYMVSFVGGAGQLFNSDTTQTYTGVAVLKQDTSVYGGGSIFPGMQTNLGFPITATADDNYFMRDCCTPSVGGYGINATGMTTTYCNVSSPAWYPGAFCNGASLSGNVYVQGGSSLDSNMGGTNQVMLMVR
jgi:hypothetical protein